MDKEKILTIIIGLLVGILAAAGYFAVTKYLPSIKSLPEKITVTPQTPSPNTLPTTNPLSLDLEDFTSTTESTIKLTGKSAPGANLLLFANADEKIASANASGVFTASLKLEDGDNQISATAFDNQGSASAVVKRNITLEISQ